MFNIFKNKDQLKGKDFDVFFITFDEPLKDQSWEDLKIQVPRAQRIDLVKGFDKAYKACAQKVQANRFISIDGDNELLPEFHRFTISQKLLASRYVLSWGAMNSINGLCYGNGGIKCWPTEIVHKMQSHENAQDEKAAVDFYYEIQYYLMPEVLTISNIHHTAYQAFRAGFREGIKMALIDGEKLKTNKDQLAKGALAQKIPKSNLERLRIWCSIGQDVQNGEWAIYGARLGLYSLYIKDMPLENIRDYDWFNSYWEQEINPQFNGSTKACENSQIFWSEEKLQAASAHLKQEIIEKLKINIVDFNSEQSSFFKSTYKNKKRKGPLK